MLNPAHILEIALLLLVAFLLGATVGALARLATSRLFGPKSVPSEVPSAPAPAGVAVAEQAPSLVAAPVIAEVVKTPTPTAPAEVPAPDFTEALLALAGDKPGSLASKIRMPSIAPLPVVAVTKPAEEMRPARVAGETTSGRVVPHPRAAAEPARAVAFEGAGAEVIPFPVGKVAVDASEPPVVVVATPLPEAEPASIVVAVQEEPKPVVDTAVELVADVQIAPPVEAEVQPDATTAVEPETIAPAEVPAQDAAVVADAAAVEAPAGELATVAPEIAQPVAPSAEEPVAATAPVITAVPEPSAEDDEAAAMRAIEGNWSPRRSASPRTRKAALPEMAADEAIPAAVVAEPPGKPVGIAAPRLGVKDDLTHVIGILPIIETALNTLGLYHFDQIAELTDENAGWIENHLGIAGRIGREHWREQARELAAATAGTKKVAGQQ